MNSLKVSFGVVAAHSLQEGAGVGESLATSSKRSFAFEVAELLHSGTTWTRN